MFSKELNEKLDQYHLLKHPFYKSWNEGKLNREIKAWISYDLGNSAFATTVIAAFFICS